MTIPRLSVSIWLRIVLGGVILCTVPPLLAQSDSAPAPSVSHGAFVRGSVVTLLATGALVPFDVVIERRMQSARVHGGSIGTHTANVFNWIGDPGTVVAPLGMIVVGWTTRQHPLLDVGIHAAEAVGISGGVTALLKGVVGRARPTDGPADADDFSAWSGFGKERNTSFPSGHTTASFALATALTFGTAQYAPRYTRVVGITTYGIATTVGLARLYTNHHWASDVVLGAGIGTLAGMVVEQHASHSNAGQAKVLRALIPSAIAPASHGGIAMAWGRNF